jgi:hypothetical protein
MTDEYELPEICPRCGCCTLIWTECDYCGGEGYTGHDCGEDCCCCLDPEDNVRCDICKGYGGWNECAGHCNGSGNHPTEPAQP